MTPRAAREDLGGWAGEHACPAVREARVLVRRLTGLLLEMRSPDGQHRALRSAYSRQGTCTVVREGHSPLCAEFFAALEASADWWDQWGESEITQPELFSEVAG